MASDTVRAERAWDDPRNSPHVAQVFLNEGAGYESRSDIGFRRTLCDDYPRLPYRRRTDEVKTVIHWGQRKLLLSEIEFLTLYGRRGHTVVYAGAAPGTHIRYLSELFPDLDFVLVDPAPFTVKESRRIRIRQELFTDDLAREYAERETLFICDVRSADMRLDEAETERQIQDDMAAQARWHDLMRPIKSIVKFRLPWKPGRTRYLAGTIYLPVWGPITTTEARLVPSEGYCEYDNSKYEEQMFFFNTRARVAVYPHDVDAVGMDHCYDCRAEVDILRQYIRVRKPKCEGSELARRVADMSSEISHACASSRTLASANWDPEVRKQGMRQRQWIDGDPAFLQAKRKRSTDTDGGRRESESRSEDGDEGDKKGEHTERSGTGEGDGWVEVRRGRDHRDGKKHRRDSGGERERERHRSRSRDRRDSKGDKPSRERKHSETS